MCVLHICMCVCMCVLLCMCVHNNTHMYVCIIMYYYKAVISGANTTINWPKLICRKQEVWAQTSSLSAPDASKTVFFLDCTAHLVHEQLHLHPPVHQIPEVGGWHHPLIGVISGERLTIWCSQSNLGLNAHKILVPLLWRVHNIYICIFSMICC